RRFHAADGERAIGRSIIPHRLLRLEQEIADLGRKRAQAMTGRSQRDTAAMTFEKRKTQFLLEFTKVCRDVRLDGVQFGGGAANAAGAGDGLEYLQISVVHGNLRPASPFAGTRANVGAERGQRYAVYQG